MTRVVSDPTQHHDKTSVRKTHRVVNDIWERDRTRRSRNSEREP